MVKIRFLIIFLFVTISFSIFAYQPIDVVIAGPQMTDLEMLELELKSIEDSTGIKIKYETYSDIETYLIENNNSDVDIAIIPNPQGVINLGDRGIVLSIDQIVSKEIMESYYSRHLQEITTSNISNKNYGAFFRLFPNSLIWYSVKKYEEIGSPEFNSYNELIDFTNNYSKENKDLWCLDIESGASTGWIATNWLEDIILNNYGVEIYDQWSNQEILSSEKPILNSINNIGKLVFTENAVYGSNKRIIRKEFRNNYKNLLNEEVGCIFSWGGHYATLYMPKEKKFQTDFDFFKFPSPFNSIVGIGDVLTVLNYDEDTKLVFDKLIDKSFGKNWMSHTDSSYIPANIKNINYIENPITSKERDLIIKSLNDNSFRYDASELMERKIGADALWVALKNYIDIGREKAYREIEDITEELDSNF